MMMEGLKPLKVGNGVVGHNEQVVIQDHQLDMGDGMQCSDHPFRNNPGGICAFCLQDKLGKLVSSSSFPSLRNSTAAASSSSSPSFRSDPKTNNATAATAALSSSSSSSSLSLSVRPKANDNATAFHHDEHYNRRARMSFLLARKKKKVSANSNEDMIFKRSKSTTTPWRAHFVDASDDFSSPRKRNGFWSFLYHQHKANSKKLDNKSFKESSKISSSSSFASSAMRGGVDNKSNMGCGEVTEDDDVSPNTQATACSFERKVSRSRSVGCGSRSFSGDIFERISTGFGDCTLRRVESQREGKAKPTSVAVVRNGAERVKCGGLFSGFMMTSSSTTTSSSSSSSYWVSSAPTEEMNGGAGRAISVHHGGAGRSGRGSSWGWAFASPMRAFSRPTSKDGKIIRKPNANSDKNTTPNLSAIPSLLSVR